MDSMENMIKDTLYTSRTQFAVIKYDCLIKVSRNLNLNIYTNSVVEYIE